MTIDEIAADMAAKAGGLEPLGKTLVFYLDDEQMLIDGTGETNRVRASSRARLHKATARYECRSIPTASCNAREIKPFMAVASGKIKVKGDMSIAAKLKKLT